MNMSEPNEPPRTRIEQAKRYAETRQHEYDMAMQRLTEARARRDALIGRIIETENRVIGGAPIGPLVNDPSLSADINTRIPAAFLAVSQAIEAERVAAGAVDQARASVAKAEAGEE
jgi:hypothetical protein